MLKILDQHLSQSYLVDSKNFRFWTITIADILGTGNQVFGECFKLQTFRCEFISYIFTKQGFAVKKLLFT
jgi:hypothetical protein